MPKVGEVAEMPVTQETQEQTTAETNGTAHAETAERDGVPIELPPELPQHQIAEVTERKQVYPEEYDLETDEDGNPIPGSGIRDFVDVMVFAKAKTTPEQPNGNALTVAKAMDFLGWETAQMRYERWDKDGTLAQKKAAGDIAPGVVNGKGIPFRGKNNGVPFDFSMLVDLEKNPIMCRHNHTNRPFDRRWAERLAQDILNGYWSFNGESIILGKSADVLSGQHRLIALIFADQRLRDPKAPAKMLKRWRENWPDGNVTIDCLVVAGIEEDDRTVRTLDNVKPRSLTDVVYTSPIFAGRDNDERRDLSKIMSGAVDHLWNRTRAGGKGDDESVDTFQTHGSSIDFLEVHGRLIHCVNLIFESNYVISLVEGKVLKEQRLTGLNLGLGKAAAVMYLMACSGTVDGGLEDEGLTTAKYFANRTETNLNFDEKWATSCRFWQELAKAGSDSQDVALNSELKPVKEAMNAMKELADLNHDGERSKDKDLFAIICRAWHQFAETGKVGDYTTIGVTSEDYGFKNGFRCFKSLDTVGGIDLGDKEKEESSTSETDESLPSKEELKKAKEEEKEAAKIAKAEEAAKKASDNLAKQKAEREARMAKMAAKSNPVTDDGTQATPNLSSPSVAEYTPEQLAAAQQRLAANQPKTDPADGGKHGKSGKKPTAKK